MLLGARQAIQLIMAILIIVAGYLAKYARKL